jgi:hypothetical protein
MPGQTITCPNPDCRASLQLAQSLPPGKKVRCSRCGTDFEPPAPAPAPAEAGTIALAPETEIPCPSCGAILPPRAVLCVGCGYNLRTGQKLEGPKKSSRNKEARERGSPSELATEELFDEADKLTRLAHKELWRIPLILGLGEDPDLSKLFNVGRPGRCANPNCQMSVEARGLSRSGMRVGTAKVKVTLRGHSVTVALCEECTGTLLAELGARNATADAYLDEAREALKEIKRRSPDDARLKEAVLELRKVELLASKDRPRGRLCFIATAAFGGPFAVEVETLRRFRDEVLARSALGRLLTQVYATLSPPLAAALAHTARGRAVVRWLLRPVAALCRRRLGPRSGRRSPFSREPQASVREHAPARSPAARG